jgi:hypothetical protein
VRKAMQFVWMETVDDGVRAALEPNRADRHGTAAAPRAASVGG